MMMNINMISSIGVMMMMIILINSKNPMKASFTILMSSSLLFLMLKTKTGQTWMPLIFFLLFMGGILMIFMILASILPNEKSMKMKFPKTMILMTILILMTNMNLKNLEKSNLSHEMKSFLTSGSTLMFMMSVILLYFFSSVSLNSSVNQSMRSTNCWKKMIL